MTWRGPATNLTPAGQARAREYRSKAHRTIRAERLAAATPATPCGYCGRPLGAPCERRARCRPGCHCAWHVPHDAARRYLPGLWHAQCNRTEAAPRGARTANAKRKATRAVAQTQYRW